ncbi:histidinol dehydrogenase [Microbacterium sp. ZW T5_45]|uniref:histidinol dehydrogenase n=1 Tax=Microbacterium sp. ZW T5_45 TaxID=3378080 RepID=UPI003851AE7F
MKWVSRALSWIAAAVVGGVFGIAGTIAHSLTWGPIPIGLIVGTIACGAILVAIRSLTHDRAATVAAGAGMVGMLLLISGVGPGGSVVVENTPAGQIWIIIVGALVLLAVAWPRLRRLPASAPTAPSASDQDLPA